MKQIWIGVLAVLLTLMLVSTSRAQSTSPVQYFYDGLGRLTKVVDQSGNIANYHYDAVGNLLSITRSTLPANNGLAILSFTPQQGPVGQAVTIQGQGFSTTASSNTIQFNGVVASVVAATATTLTATVPVGATTGLISVTVSGVNASSDTNFTVSSLVSIAVTPTNSTFSIGSTVQQFRAVGNYSNSTMVDITAQVSWSSSNTLVATISNAAGTQGLATAGIGVGTTTITATLGSLNGSTSLQVATPVGLIISPPDPVMIIGAKQQLTVTGLYSNGVEQSLSASAVTWNSGTGVGVATISSQGVLTAIGPGLTNISVQLGSATGSGVVTVQGLQSVSVTPLNPSILVGQAQQFTATASYVGGSPQTVTTSATWNSYDPAVATVSNSPGTQGVVVGVKGGYTNICATFTTGGVTQTGCVNGIYVTPVLQSISVTPAGVSLPKGETQQFAATGTYNDGSTQTIYSSLTWNSSNSATATINSSTGVATAVAVGTTTITATSGSVTGSTTLTITPPVPVSMVLNPATTGIVQGGTLQFDAIAVMSDGTLGPDITTTSAWSSSYPTIATISNASGSQGLATGVGLGVVTITATSGAFTASATLIVRSSSATNIPRFAFAPNSNDDTISVYVVNPATGQLRANGYVVEATGSKPVAVALDPTGKFLFVANSGLNTVAAYTINATNGALTPVAGSPFAAGFTPTAVVVSPTADFVYVVNSGDNTTWGFAFDPTSGVLTAVPGSPFAVGTKPNSAVVDNTGQFLYVTNSSDGTISAFTISSGTGSLMPVVGSPFAAGTNPLGITIDPSNTFVLVTNGKAGGGAPVSELRRPHSVPGSTATGLARGQGFRVAKIGYKQEYGDAFATEGPGPFVAAVPEFALPQSGGGTVGTGAGVSVFTINSTTGALTAVSGSPFATSGSSPFAVAVDPSDRFVFALDTFGGLSVFSISAASGGTLSLLPGSPYATDYSPLSVTVDPSGLFVYVAGGTADDVTFYGISPTAGTLISFGSLPGRQGPAGLAISKGTSGVQYTPQYAYVAASGGTGGTAGSNNVIGFAIDPVAGGLTALSGSPFAEGYSPEYAASDPLGRFLYVANICSDPACSATAGSVSAYDIISGTGVLTSAPNSSALAGTGPVGVAVDPSGRFAYVLNSKDLTISGYAMDPTTGALSPISGSPFAFGGGGGVVDPALAIAIDLAGRFLYAVTGCLDGSCSANIYALSINPVSGALTSASSASLPTGMIPSSLALAPRGGLVFVADSASGDVLVFTVSATYAYLNQLTNSTVLAGTGPSFLAMEPTGNYLYVANANSNSVSAFFVNIASGTLTPVPGSPFAVGTSPVSISIDPSGVFLYVVNEGSNTVSAFSISSSNGSLAPAPGSPSAAGTAPISITTTGKTQ
jgi:YD repeat-containing protein